MRDKKGRFIKGHKINMGRKILNRKKWTLSKESRRKISESLKGKPSNSLGKKWTIESRKKFSEQCGGKNGNNWQGGIKPINKTIRAGIEFRLWREAVFARDNWNCQKTGIKGGKLIPHHILNFAEYPKLRFAIDNGITLCEKCHKVSGQKLGGG